MTAQVLFLHVFFRKKTHTLMPLRMCDFSEKGQKKAKYLKIWSKVYKM